MREKILQVLRNNPQGLTIKEIEDNDELGSISTIQRVLSELRKEKLVIMRTRNRMVKRHYFSDQNRDRVTSVQYYILNPNTNTNQ